jgi:hypothetical protein
MNSSVLAQNQETDPAPATPDFRTLFCKRYQCQPSEFEEQAFRMCLYWRARILAPFITAIRPRYFERDLLLIRYLAKAPGRRDAQNELAAHIEANDARGGFARKMLRIRISARKVNSLLWRLFEEE